MVALKIKTALFLIMCAAVAGSVGAQTPSARLSGLEHNAEYMSMLERDAVLSERIDSLSSTISDCREQLSSEGNANELRYSILELEGELYELRSERTKLAARINAVEQEWLVANISSAAEDDDATETVSESTDAREYADLVRNGYFVRSLSRNEYSTLLQAQRYESTATRLYSDFAKAHGAAASLKGQYEAAKTESAADSLLSLLSEAKSRYTMLSDSLSSVWNYVFDNKTYIYDLLFDKEGREDMLEKSERSIFSARQKLDAARGRFASDAVAEYALQKPCLTGYEADMAAFAGLTSAADSIARIRRTLGSLKYDFGKVEVARRSFIKYEPVKLSSQYVYNANNPVPECEVYEHGVIYRIKLGDFTAKQPAAKFKGIEPVGYLRTSGGLWKYYAGGYASAEDAEKPLAALKRLGFRSADIVVWVDGEYADNRREAEELASKSYTVELSGADNLSSAVRDVINLHSAENAVTRTGKGTYIIGGFRSEREAASFAAAVSAADRRLSANVSEVAIEK